MIDVELEVPLHRASTSQLMDLCNYLGEIRYNEREEQIAKAVDLAVQAWEGRESSTYIAWSPSSTPQPAWSLPTAPIAHIQTYRIILPRLPENFPPEYVRPVFDRMIRDQLREEGIYE